MKKIIFATKNKGKLKEIQEILGHDFDISSMQDAGLDLEIEENGKTFIENALIKAETVMKASGEIALADDSGLEIDYLDKAPGIYSARYMGESTPYDIKNAKILELLNGIEQNRRTARFVCAVAAVFPDGHRETVQETIEGIIGYEIKGSNGFGYDPIFYVPAYSMTTAEMPMELKNSISHRGKALRAIKERLCRHD